MLSGRGIYALWWEDPDILNISSSPNLGLTEYRTNLYFNQGNHPLQEVYNKYGTPELVVLEYCESKLLQATEKSWKLEFAGD